MPALEMVAGDIEDEQSLDQGGRRPDTAGESSLPSDDVEPASHVTENTLARSRRKHGGPVILPA